jgi:hypothetical protein
MSDYLNIAIIALVGLVQASLQLNLGGLILLYHASMGKHRRRKTRYLAKSYIWGAMAINFLAVCASCFVIDRIFSGVMDTKWLLITIGALAACGTIMWILYYKRGAGTEIWLPRSFTRYIRKKSRETNDDIGAFSLGMLSAFGEMPLSLVLYVVAGNAILLTSAKYQLWMALFYALLTALPMVVLNMRIKSGSNVVAAQKWRIKNKRFTRVISGVGFFVLGWFIFTYWVM